MMAIAAEPKYSGDWLKWEEEDLYSREQVTILGGSGSDRVLTTGMVVGKITASGKYVQMDPAAADGSENAAGILLLDTTAPDAVDVQATIIAREAIVSENEITWIGTATAPQIAAATAQLVALTILVREDA